MDGTATEPAQGTAPVFTITSLLPDWQTSLRAMNRSDLTVLSYSNVAKSLDAFLADKGMPREVASIRREHVEAWLASMTNLAPATRAKSFRSAQQLFRWLLDEGEIAESPMQRMRPPTVPRQIVEVLTEAELRRLFAACDGPTFTQRRDVALLRFMADTGSRASEVMGLRVDDVDLTLNTARITGKGSHERVVAFGPKTAEALRRYLRARTREGHGSTGWLWLGRKGRLTDSGLRQLLERRGADAGIPNLHPHRFRHTWAHRWLSKGGTESDAMTLGGWRSRQMLDRYGASAAQSRAIEAAHRMSLGDI